MQKTSSDNDRLFTLKHDIRNPLYIAQNLIQVHLAQLEHSGSKADRPTQDDTKAVLRQSAEMIERVLGTLRKLNGFLNGPYEKRVNNGAGVRVSVRETLQGIVEAARSEGFLRHMNLVLSIPNDLPYLNIDRAELEEIFYNLIGNAAQALKRGGQLLVKAEFEPEPAPSVAIAFQDRGCGIPSDVLPYIFEPFCTTRGDDNGNGFGLYIVRQLVERNGGQIHVLSRVNLGTTFTLIFPLEHTSQAA